MLVLWAFTLAPISLVAPMREVSIVFACVLSWLLLRERQSLQRVVGAALVVAGVVALGFA